jgi:hypothetical protein
MNEAKPAATDPACGRPMPGQYNPHPGTSAAAGDGGGQRQV